MDGYTIYAKIKNKFKLLKKFSPQLVILKNFKPAEKLKEQYSI